MTGAHISREQAAALYDKVLRGLRPDKVVEDRILELEQHDADERSHVQ
jgi:hypothetical protein